MSRTRIDDLSDELLVRILWHNKQPTSRQLDSDALWESSASKPKYFTTKRYAEDFLPNRDGPLPTPPASADAAVNLLVASVCRRWRHLARRYVSTLLIKDELMVSRLDISNAITCFPNLTHLEICLAGGETFDDAFLKHLASSCPKLTILNLTCETSRLMAENRIDLFPITEAGLDQFFRQCTQLEQLQLFCLHEKSQLPASFFRQKRLHTLALHFGGPLLAPALENLSSLTVLEIASAAVEYQDPTSLTKLFQLTSLSISNAYCRSDDSPHERFSIAQLPFLKKLTCFSSSPAFDLLFPSGSPCTSLERLLITDCRELERFPQDIADLLPSLRELSLDWCPTIAELPEAFLSLSRLDCLKITSCENLSSLPRNFGRLPALKSLVLEDLFLSDLPDSLCHLSSLETLFLIGCREIRQLPPGFCYLTALKTLCLVELLQIVLPASIGALCNLHTFCLKGSQEQQQLPSSFPRLSSLTRLEINTCSLVKLPEEMGELSNLRELHINACPIEELPESLTVMAGLEILMVNGCKRLRAVPSRMDVFGRLRVLEFVGCELLGELPELLPRSLEIFDLGNFSRVTPLPNITLLPKLRKLKLRNVEVVWGITVSKNLSSLENLQLALAGDFNELPLPLAPLSQLRTLTIRSALKVEALPSFGSMLMQLRKLCIHDVGELKELPASIVELPRLTFLGVHAPKLASLPAELGALSRLRELDLSECSSLQYLPASLTQLARLCSLNVKNSLIRSLPAGFVRLTRLSSLDLQGCAHLEALPEDLTELKLLWCLNVTGCEKVFDDEGFVLPCSIHEINGLELCK
ncbi:hypothetical protein CLOM_g14082 [Closterium sp. NIES-68]|nr:hypothetical protein CLOM_g24257 [Closterium sp. NIES-68]GJP55102.1 hypothetical protein CLOM_g14082 [Closterium sp. NIES-68]GJP85548.1 hypothetical protein CLOP_g15631 [Closterium sp. NIES-67]